MKKLCQPFISTRNMQNFLNQRFHLFICSALYIRGQEPMLIENRIKSCWEASRPAATWTRELFIVKMKDNNRTYDTIVFLCHIQWNRDWKKRKKNYGCVIMLDKIFAILWAETSKNYASARAKSIGLNTSRIEGEYINRRHGSRMYLVDKPEPQVRKQFFFFNYESSHMQMDSSNIKIVLLFLIPISIFGQVSFRACVVKLFAWISCVKQKSLCSWIKDQAWIQWSR